MSIAFTVALCFASGALGWLAGRVITAAHVDNIRADIRNAVTTLKAAKGDAGKIITELQGKTPPGVSGSSPTKPAA